MNPHISLYTKDTVNTLEWPNNKEGVYAENYLTPLIKNGIRPYIENIDAELFVLKVDDKILPLTLIDKQYKNALFASPYTHYLTFTLEELSEINNFFLETIFRFLILIMGPLFKACKFNKVIYVNNWLFSTTVYPGLSSHQVSGIRKFLVEKFPDHCIIFRTVDDILGDEFMNFFEKDNFKLVYSRPTYHLNPFVEKYRRSKNLRSDINKLKKTDYSVITAKEMTEDDIPRLQELYQMLYVDKYSRYNPIYTEKFFQLALRGAGIELLGLKKDGRIDGFLGFYGNDKILTAPLLGYDMNLPRELNLYRILVASLFLRGQENGQIINFSAGVGRFKMLRGCENRMEYIAVYDKHLPRNRRIPWAILKFLNRIVVPLMKELKM
ncbi:MAG: GNAT family N-acetyltransferase [bacterium]|nr:GNAT family N-acetyltransferase [bacterium]